MKFVHLHTHSCYSLLDGLSTPKELATKARMMGMPAVALTDHGNLYAAYKFYHECQEQSIKPILGQEFYYVPDRTVKDKSNRHVVLLAKNLQGWKNLMRLSSLAYLEGFYYKPRIDAELVGKYHEGLIAMSACCSGIIAKLILEGDAEKIMEEWRRWVGWFKGDFYLEIMPLDFAIQKIINVELVEMSNKFQIPLVATADSHYPNRDDYKVHEIATKVRSSSDFVLEATDLWFRNEEEMKQGFAEHHPMIPENIVWLAMNNTIEIANRIERFDIKPKYRMPTVDIQIAGS